MVYGSFPGLNLSPAMPDSVTHCPGAEIKPAAPPQELLLQLDFFFFRAAPAVGSSQARGQMGAIAASLHHHSHSNSGSKTHLLPTPQLMVMLDP